MRLEAYLQRNGETAADFARRIEVTAVAVHRYIHKKRIPEPDVMARIVEACGGDVQPNDFYTDHTPGIGEPAEPSPES